MLDTIESALEDIRAGKLVIVVDDEDRENEGDFITAARNVTPEVINFMSKHGRGLICAPITEERCDELSLKLMVENKYRAAPDALHRIGRFKGPWLHHRHLCCRPREDRAGIDKSRNKA